MAYPSGVGRATPKGLPPILVETDIDILVSDMVVSESFIEILVIDDHDEPAVLL